MTCPGLRSPGRANSRTRKEPWPGSCSWCRCPSSSSSSCSSTPSARFKDAAIIICNIPFALVGGVFALLHRHPLSVSAAIGFIALFGQAVLNGVVMVSYFNQLKQRGWARHEVVFRGAMSRLRTVLMTALLAMLGLVPMALSHGIGSKPSGPWPWW